MLSEALTRRTHRLVYIAIIILVAVIAVGGFFYAKYFL
jgi:hypothetical protein